MNEEIEVRTPPAPVKDQADLNVEVYESVFMKCLDAAERILEKTTPRSDGVSFQERKIVIATSLFEQFFADQSAEKSAQRNAQAMMSGMNSILEGRAR